MMKKWLILNLCLLLSISLHGQGFRVKGIVADSSGTRIPGAAVVVQGSGTVTSDDGTFLLDVPSEGTVLEVSSLGYRSVRVSAAADMMIVLEEDVKLIEESVVVGYGSMRRSDLTGAVTSVTVDESDAARMGTLDEMLSGRASGVQVLQSSASPDAGVSIRIRGLNSFTNGASEPLYVVDGVIIGGSSAAETLMVNGSMDNGNNEQTNGLAGINPQDIERIEILKDASATAIYGAQGANGVVLITTKEAAREKPVIRVSTGVDVSVPNKKIPMLSFDGYVDYLVASGKSISHIYEDPAAREGLKVQPMDWQDYMMRTAVSRRGYASFSGKASGMSYFLSLGLSDKEGIVRNSGASQYTARLNLSRPFVGGKVKVGTRSSFAYLTSSLVSGANANRITAAASMMRSMLSYRPFMSIEADDEDLDTEDETYVGGPDRWVKYFRSTREEFRFTPSLFVEWAVTPWLSFRSSGGADYKSAEYARWKSRTISSLTGSIGSISQFNEFHGNWDNMLLVNKSFGRHSLSGTLGMTMSVTDKSTVLSEGWFIRQDRAMLASVNSAEPPYSDLDYMHIETSLMSFLARAVYNYRDRYVLTATMRLDGSSKFLGRNKWAGFPSAAFAWRVNQEPWFDLDAVSVLKLRLGWGMVGNQSIAPYKTLSTYAGTSVADHTPENAAASLVAIYPDILANPSLKWETTSQANGGFDLGLFRGRLTVSGDIYHKMTRDLLQTINISKSAGYASMPVNQGAVLNKGFEVSMNAVPVKTGGLEWNLNGQFSLNRNRIVKIGSGMNYGTLYLAPGEQIEAEYFYGSTLRSTADNLGVLNWFIEGQPMGLFYGFMTDGIVPSGETGPGFGETGTPAGPGMFRYVDVNGNGYIDPGDRVIIGDPNPDFTYGFGTSLSWKGWNFSVNFTGRKGGDIYNINTWQDFQNKISSATQARNIRQEAFTGAWTPENGGIWPALDAPELDRYIDRFVEDGSYLRLQDVSMSYLFTLKKSFVKTVSLGISAKNLYVWTRYSQWDPDVNSFGSDIRRMGVDSGSYPGARAFSFDLRFVF